MKSIARFWTRLAGPGDGLFVGVTLSQNVFEPNTVYEIVDILGQMVIRKVGKGLVAETGQTVHDSPLGVHVASSIDNVLVKGGKYLFLSRPEYESIYTVPVDNK